MVRPTRPDVDRLPLEERERVGLVIGRVPPGVDDNEWGIVMSRVLWTGPRLGPEGRLTLEPDHRLSIVMTEES